MWLPWELGAISAPPDGNASVPLVPGDNHGEGRGSRGPPRRVQGMTTETCLEEQGLADARGPP